jgi:hypothetical protein
MCTKTSSYPIDEAAPPSVASSLKTGRAPDEWRKTGQAVGAMLTGLAAPTRRIPSDDEFGMLKELVARLEAENAGLRRQIQIYRELCTVD